MLVIHGFMACMTVGTLAPFASYQYVDECVLLVQSGVVKLNITFKIAVNGKGQRHGVVRFHEVVNKFVNHVDFDSQDIQWRFIAQANSRACKARNIFAEVRHTYRITPMPLKIGVRRGQINRIVTPAHAYNSSEACLHRGAIIKDLNCSFVPHSGRYCRVFAMAATRTRMIKPAVNPGMNHSLMPRLHTQFDRATSCFPRSCYPISIDSFCSRLRDRVQSRQKERY
uniref:Lipocalin n=1 Tax=Panagrellus redivivus TaxID=6233 RepID=A0A7E4VE53_PANRE